MQTIWMLLIGLVIGAIAKLFMPGKDPGGFIVTMLIGVAGSMLAGVIGHAVGFYDTAGAGPGIIASVLGAMLLLFVYRALSSKKKSIR